MCSKRKRVLFFWSERNFLIDSLVIVLIMNPQRKYCRSLHAQISLGTSSDDRFMPNTYVQAFAKMDDLVLTEKLDGQNNCFNKYGLFARSHASPSIHPWDKALRERWQLIKNDLGKLELFGENMFGIHSIAYRKLESYFYLFAVREGERWLSWEEVQFYADAFGFPTVPEIPITFPLKDYFYENKSKKENHILSEWIKLNLGMAWEKSVQSEGLLGGYNPLTNQAASEGFVIRNKNSFQTNEGSIPVAKNEFNNLFKIVRAEHVQTDIHWTKNWKAAPLIDYQKHQWQSYEYLSKR